MCGIYGGHPSQLVANPAHLTLHRGPDQQGAMFVKDGGGHEIVLGMTRLSIVDVTPMDIPFQSDGYAIVFNGEIYNWRELRSDLEDKGYQFVTNTDTEVVLYAYREYGSNCLKKFNGMFAVAIWHEGILFLARDRVGEKPLFYTKSTNRFSFASEIKAFRNLTYEPVSICEKTEFYFDEHTPYKKIYSLRPGEFLTWNSSTNKITQCRWWEFPRYTGCISDEEEALAEFLPLFRDACEIRRNADVPVTVFLSGGIDSSLIQAVLGLPTTYTVQFNEYEKLINEIQYTGEFARACNFENRIVKPSKKDFQSVFHLLARHIEFPVGSFSIYPLYCLGRQAKEDGFKVALSGEGADELFNGYFRNQILIEERGHIDAYHSGDYRQLAQRYFGPDLERFTRMANRHEARNDRELLDLFNARWNKHAPMHHNISKLETEIFLQPLLTMADRMSMANSMEVRTPFLDYRIIEFSAKLAPKLRFCNGQGKYLLRIALKRLIGDMNLGITKRSVKHGLPAPINKWIFKKDGFDRTAWNQVVMAECLQQIQS
jgi:asparagine synthase (glutamine-hydrolysing)